MNSYFADSGYLAGLDEVNPRCWTMVERIYPNLSRYSTGLSPSSFSLIRS
jgi:hypothetical protein